MSILYILFYLSRLFIDLISAGLSLYIVLMFYISFNKLIKISKHKIKSIFITNLYKLTYFSISSKKISINCLLFSFFIYKDHNS